MREIIIHYHRDDGDYSTWGVWLWPEGYGGEWVSFCAEDDFGKIARYQVPKKHERIGFLIRGTSWEKDVDQDRYIEDFIGDQAEIWLVAGDSQVYLAPPAHLRRYVRAFQELEVVIHYYRYDGDYSGWNLWLWGSGEEGRSLEFIGEDAYGPFARTILKQQTDGAELGFILRKSSEREAWVGRDGSGDRFIPLYRTSEEGKLEVWLMQSDPKIYYRQADVNKTPQLTRAFLNDVDLLRVECYLPLNHQKDKNRGFTLFNSKNEEIPLARITQKGSLGKNRWLFTLRSENPLDLTESYQLNHVTHGTCQVVFNQVFSSKAFASEFHYSGSDLGVSYTPQQTSFKVWAPTATKVELVIYQTAEEEKGEVIPLSKEEKGIWQIDLRTDLEGYYYNFLVTHGKVTKEVVDPYAKAAGVNGRRGQIVDLAKTNPPAWDKVTLLELEAPVDAVIYEMHVRDFSTSPTSGIKAKGQYLGVIEKGTKTSAGVATGFDHLADLGVTHLHFLPIFDFATVDERAPEKDYNWGYDPLNYNLPEGSYASNPSDGRVRIRELKTMIKALNKAGLGVIMDVVYNHTYHSTVSALNKLVPGYYYRLHADGSFSNGSGCGNELADERSMVRKFIVDSVLYWAREYKVAGFRFDLMGLHHIETMQAVRRALDQIDPRILIYGEGWAAAGSTLPEEVRAVKKNTPLLTGIASFGNDFRDAVKGHVFHTQEPGFIQGGGAKETVKFGIVGAIEHPQINYHDLLYTNGPWALQPSQNVLYVEAHDNLTLWDKLLCTTPPEADEKRVALMKLAHVLVLTSQGIPFLHAGQEFARTKGGDPNSYQSPDHINQLDWERKGKFLGLYNYTKDLIKLRKTRAAFRLREKKEIQEKLRFLDFLPGNMLGYTLGPYAGGDFYETILVLFNSGKEKSEFTLPTGRWLLLADHAKVYLSEERGVEGQIALPGWSALIVAKEGA